MILNAMYTQLKLVLIFIEKMYYELLSPIFSFKKCLHEANIISWQDFFSIRCTELMQVAVTWVFVG